MFWYALGSAPLLSPPIQADGPTVCAPSHPEMWPSCPSSTWTSRWCTRWTASWGGYRWSRQPRAGSTATPTSSYWCGSTMITTMRGSWGTGGPTAFRRLAWPRCTTLDMMSLLGWIWRIVRRSISEWFSFYLLMRVASYGCMCRFVVLLLHLARSPHFLLGRLSDDVRP